MAVYKASTDRAGMLRKTERFQRRPHGCHAHADAALLLRPADGLAQSGIRMR
jgi:hypothetical protein